MESRVGALAVLLVVGLAVVMSAGVGTAAGGETVVTVQTEGESAVSLGFGLTPKVLPVRGRQVAKLVIGVEEEGAEGIPPGISRATFGIDRAIELDPLGFPPCRSPATEGVQVDSAGASETDCRRSIVGRAEAKIMFAYPENDPITVVGRGIVYFAGDRPGGSDLLVKLPFGMPLSGNLDLIVPIRSVSERGIGTDLRIKIPEIADGYGILRSLRLELGRVYSRGGERADYVDAECRRGKLRAALSVVLGDGTEAREESTRACSVAG
jgi:hypothetical protein